jgi:hypothetical protein
MKDPTRTIEFHIRYLQALRMCQVHGTKLGHFNCHPYRGSATYVLDGKVWQFNCGVILGPQDYFVWRSNTQWDGSKNF